MTETERTNLLGRAVTQLNVLALCLVCSIAACIFTMHHQNQVIQELRAENRQLRTSIIEKTP